MVINISYKGHGSFAIATWRRHEVVDGYYAHSLSLCGQSSRGRLPVWTVKGVAALTVASSLFGLVVRDPTFNLSSSFVLFFFRYSNSDSEYLGSSHRTLVWAVAPHLLGIISYTR